MEGRENIFDPHGRIWWKYIRSTEEKEIRNLRTNVEMQCVHEGQDGWKSKIGDLNFWTATLRIHGWILVIQNGRGGALVRIKVANALRRFFI